MKRLKKGRRVKIVSLGIKGKVVYVDEKNYFSHHLYPIQVELDKPYDESGQTTYRTNLLDLIKLKKKKAAQINEKDQELWDFTAV